MKLAILILLGLIAVLFVTIYLKRASRSAMSPADFTAAAAQNLRNTCPGLTVTVVEDLHLKVTTNTGRDFGGFLNNVYDLYKQDPSTLAAVLKQHAASLSDVAAAGPDLTLDRERIIPVIKDRAWIVEAQSRARPGQPIALLVEDLNSELAIVYGEDRPNNIHYFGESDLKTAGIDRAGLRELACANLKRTLTKIERQGEKGYYLYTAGGDYEASLILLNLWSPEKCSVEGDVVFAIPTRDVLLVTGSRSPDGLARLKQGIANLSADAPYRLSTKMFVMRDGRIDLFEPPSNR